MKIRTGFVSNSSSSSFCIYGWTDEDLGLDYHRTYELHDKLKKLCNAVSSSHPSAELVIGVGNTNSDMDHYDENWESYECDAPSQEEMKKLDAIAEHLSLPKPTMHSATWYNG